MELDLKIEGLSADDVLLVSGPSMSGKYQLFRRILSQNADGLIIISTSHPARKIEADFLDSGSGSGISRLGVIECGGSRAPGGDSVSSNTTVKRVSSPQNMTNLGVKFTELVDEFHDHEEIDHVGVGVHSVTSLVMHSDIRLVFQFLQVLTGQIRSAGWLGVAVVDTGIDQDEKLVMLQHHFDGVIETRESEGGSREFRIRGLEPQASDWRGF